MLLQFPNGDPFATGAIAYAYRPATSRETTNRIVLPIEVELSGRVETEAFLDTGAPYMILDPNIAKAIGFTPELALDKTRMLIRGQTLEGSLIRLTIHLLATEGQDLSIDATAFVADSIDRWGNFPSILGLSGFLERVRYAIDPNTDTFYFGSP